MNVQRLRHVAVALLATLVAGVAIAQTPAQLAYRVGKEQISATFKADRIICARLAEHSRDVCFAEATARKKTAQASLEFGTSGRPADALRVAQAQAEADFAVARQRCMARQGQVRHLCIQQARALETHAIVDARTKRKMLELQQHAAQKKRDVWYDVAASKCDALDPHARGDCIATAKAQFGKS